MRRHVWGNQQLLRVKFCYAAACEICTSAHYCPFPAASDCLFGTVSGLLPRHPYSLSSNGQTCFFFSFDLIQSSSIPFWKRNPCAYCNMRNRLTNRRADPLQKLTLVVKTHPILAMSALDPMSNHDIRIPCPSKEDRHSANEEIDVQYRNVGVQKLATKADFTVTWDRRSSSRKSRTLNFS